MEVTNLHVSLWHGPGRVWLDGVVMVMLIAPWETQRAGAKCLSRAVEASPDLALFLLDSLEATQLKVNSHDVMMMSLHVTYYTLHRVISILNRF